MNFRSFLFSSACALALGASHAHAADQPVVEFDSVASFRAWASAATAGDLQGLASFHLASYYCLTPDDRTGPSCPNDGGEGLFIQKSDTAADPAVCLVGIDDGGSVLVENKNGVKYCFYRANLNGDIRQFGVTKDSNYDCSPADGGVGGCESITANGTTAGDDRFGKLLAAATAAGLHNLTFAGLQLWTDHDVELPTGIALDLGGVSPLGQHHPNLLDFPGTLFLDEGKAVKMGDHTALRNGMILPDWYVPPTDIGTMYAQRQTMVTNADTGVLCNGPSCIVENLEIDGFDTAFEADHPTGTVVNSVAADGNVCFDVHGAGQSTIQNTKCFPNISVAFDESGDRLANQEYFRVTDVDEAPTGKMCRVTIAPIAGGPPVSDVQDGFIVWGSGADAGTGGANIDSRFHALATGTSGVFDLDGSYCDLDTGDNSLEGPSVVSAHWTKGDNRLYIDTATPPMDQILTHEVITNLGTSGIPEGDEITGVWRTKHIVILGTPATQSGSGAVTFRSAAYTEPMHQCDGSNQGVCLVLDASARVEAGASTGGSDAGGIATGYMIGGPDKTGDEVTGLNGVNTSVYSHAVEYHVRNSNEIHLLSPQNDSAAYSDPSTIYAWVNDDSNQVAFIGGKGSKAGTGVLVDIGADECLNFVAQNAQPSTQTYNQFEVDGGCFIAQGVRPGTGNIFIADDASHVDLSESYLAKASIWYQSDVAQGKTSTLTTTVSSGQNNLINQSYDATTGDQNPAPQPSADTLLQIAQSDGVKNRVLQDSVGETTVVSGRRADGTASSRTAVQDGEQLAEFGGIGFNGSAYPADDAAGVGVEACENWTTSTNCAAATLKATEKGTTTIAEVARAESGGLGIGTKQAGLPVQAPLEVVNAGTTTHASNIHALLTSGTGSITVTSASGFPSPGILLVDSELMAYSKIDSTHLDVTTRGVWGTTAQTHSNNSGSTLSFLNVLVGNSSTALPQFAVTSRGGVWHLTTSGGAPAIDTTGGGGAGAGSPSIVGNDNAGRITLGTPASAVLKLNFATSWSNAPVCFAQDESATARNPWIVTAVSASSVTFTGPGTPSNGDVLSYTCTGFK